MRFPVILLFISLYTAVFSQTFTRSELSTTVNSPWEIIYGPDNYLWLTESGGKVSRVDPNTGVKTVVYTAPDYSNSFPEERSPYCFGPYMGYGTLGMALHPDFLTGEPYIYFVHSYNSRSVIDPPATRFKIRRLTWDAGTKSVSADTTLVGQLLSGYDHLGGRLMVIKQNGIPYLFFSMGDHGISETNSPDCYANQVNNPNNLAQNPAHPNGKIHRYNINGSIPLSNPIQYNPFYTRGHRNPQGLMYNPVNNLIYDIEHGDRTDDEINVLEAGMNYGWKDVRGYMNDNNYPGEAGYIAGYTGHPQIAGDALKGPLYSWCATPQPATSTYTDWCTVAPSDGIYYNHPGIADWVNSLLVVTLKDGINTDMELYRFKLNVDGKSLVPSTVSEPNPKKYFGEDQKLNGRLRDITVSPDGTKIYLVNNGGADRDKISVYTVNPGAGIVPQTAAEFSLSVYPNPFDGYLYFSSNELILEVNIYNLVGELVKQKTVNDYRFKIEDLPKGAYIASIRCNNGSSQVKKIFGK